MKKFNIIFIIIAFILLCSCIFSVACEKDKDLSILSIEAVADSFVTKYTVGDKLKLDGAKIKVNYSDGHFEIIPVNEQMVEKSSFSTDFPANRKTMKIFYNNCVCNVYYQVEDKKAEITIKNAYLENMPSSFLKGETLTLSNGFIENALLCIELSNGNLFKYPVKGIWINSFSTDKAGTCSCTVDYESDFGAVMVVWSYTVQDLSPVDIVVFDYEVSIYQNQTESDLRKALTDKSFLVKYADGTQEILTFDSNFKITSFTSDKIGIAHCSISFKDSMNRNVKYNLEYTVKKVFKVYSVTFDPNYEGSAKITVKTSDGKVTAPNLNRNGYATPVWYLYDGNTLSSVPFNFDSVIENDIVLRPRWKTISYTITIYSFGTLYKTENYTVEKAIPLEAPSPVEGYTFSHFADEQGKVYTSIPKGTFGNLVLNCVWTPIGFDIEYDLNDGDSSFKATNPNPNKYNNESVLELLPPQRNGYNFLGWFYNNGQITSTEGLSKNIKLTAKWAIAEYTLSLVNPLTEEIIRSIKFKITDSNTKISEYQSDLYFFYGWYKDKEFCEEFSFDSSHQYFLPSGSFGDMSIYAKLEIKYTISLDSRNNTASTSLFFKDSDEYINLPIPTKFGSDFLCWLGQGIFNGFSLSPDNGIIRIDASEIKSVMAENNVQLANFVATYDYHLHDIVYNIYTDYAGNPVTSTDSYYTNIQKDLLVPERSGYVFHGWYANPEFSGQLFERISAFSHDEDIVLFAKWQANVYSLSLDFFFENVQTDYVPDTYTADDQITLPIPSYPNYSFIGWYKDKDYSVSQSRFIDKGTTGDLTLYALWEAIPIEMVLYNTSGAIYNGNIDYTIEQETVSLADASKKGYNFEGWFLDKNLTTEVSEFKPCDYPYSRPFTAYAKWSTINYSINYVLNDSTVFPAVNENPVTITIEDTVKLISPERIGYNFSGWYFSSSLDGNQTNTLSMVSNDVTLYAKWEVREYKLSYENCYFENVDTSKLPSSFKASAVGTSVSVLSRKHYTFDGWFIGDTKISKVGLASDASLCDDLTLTAKWTPKNYTLTLTVNGKKGTLNYNIEQFIDDVYIIPQLSNLIPSIFDENVLIGKEFIGWYKGSNTSVLFTQIDVNELANLSFNALTSYITYNVVYHLPENAINAESNPTNFTMQSKTISISSATLESKVFVAWFLDENLQTSAGTVSSGKTLVSTINGDLHLYAKFADIHNIVYNLPSDVSLTSTAPTTYNVTKSVTITAPSATKYNFAGWWWVENKKVVTTTADFGDFGNVTLLPLLYDKTASAKLSFILDEQSLTASVVGYSGSSTLKFPAEVSGYRVVSIVDTAFFGNNVITSVTIPNTISSVGYRAFANCSKLASVVIEGGSIASEAFANCPLLKTVSILPEAVVSDGVFANCIGLTTMSVSNNKAVVCYFAKTANSSCTVCGGYYVPNTLTTIKLVGNPIASNGILSACSLVKNFYLDCTTFVEISAIDLNILKNNNVQIYVKAELLEEYNDRYKDLSFTSF